MSLRRTGPGLQHHLPGADPKNAQPGAGIQPRYSGLRVQGTAISPSSAAKLDYNGGERGIRTLERLNTVTRFPGERLRPTQPSLQAKQSVIL